MKQRVIYKKKKRNSKEKIKKKILLISVEGVNKTERFYFGRFESNYYKIRFVRSGLTDPCGLMKELYKEYKKLGLSEKSGDKGVALVDSDCDCKKDSSIKEADKFKKQNIWQIVSSPCFEIWFLCHFEYSTRGYNSQNDVIEQLTKYIKDYSKSIENMYEKLFDKMEKAINNAEKLYKECIEKYGDDKEHSVGFAPSTEVYKVIKLLRYDKI